MRGARYPPPLSMLELRQEASQLEDELEIAIMTGGARDIHARSRCTDPSSQRLAG